MTDLRFAIHCRPYVHNSAGIRGTHMLAPLLAKHGIEAITISPKENWEWSISPDFVHVYCDNDFPCNPYRQTRVRWWLGNRSIDIDPTELNVTWNTDLHPGMPRLMLDTIDRNIFYPKTEPSNGVLYYNGKGPTWPWDGIVREVPSANRNWRVMTRHEPKTREEVAEWLRAASLLVCNDAYSAIVMESVICGTPVLLRGKIVEPPLGLHLGVARSWGDVPRAAMSAQFAADTYDVIMRSAASDVPDFIRLCRERFQL